VEPRGAPVRHEIGNCVIHSIIFAEIIGSMVALKIQRLSDLAQHHAPFRILWWLSGSSLVRFFVRRNAAKVFFYNRYCLGGFYIASDRYNHVGGYVVGVKESPRVGCRKRIQV